MEELAAEQTKQATLSAELEKYAACDPEVLKAKRKTSQSNSNNMRFIPCRHTGHCAP